MNKKHQKIWNTNWTHCLKYIEIIQSRFKLKIKIKKYIIKYGILN